MAGGQRVEAPGRADLNPQRQTTAAAAGLVDVGDPQVNVVQIAAQFVAIADNSHADPVLDQWQIYIAFDLVAALAALGPGDAAQDARPQGFQVGPVGDDLVDAGHRAGPIERPLRPANDLDPIDIHQPQVGIGRIVIDRRLIEIGADSGARSTGKSPVRQPADQQLVAAGAEVGGKHAGQLAHGAADVDGARRGDLAARYGADAGRETVHRHRTLGGGDHHLGDQGRRPWRIAFRGGRQRWGRRRHSDAHGARVDDPIATGRAGQQTR